MNAKHKPFTKYSLEEAYELLHLGNPITWDIPFKPIEPSAFFHEELRRMDAFEMTPSSVRPILGESACGLKNEILRSTLG